MTNGTPSSAASTTNSQSYDEHPEVELVYSLSLSQEAYYRVRRAVEAGRPLKRAFSDVARELNALGYRNANQALLRASSIERRYYEINRTKRR